MKNIGNSFGNRKKFINLLKVVYQGKAKRVNLEKILFPGMDKSIY
jgi:hypothetical protein